MNSYYSSSTVKTPEPRSPFTPFNNSGRTEKRILVGGKWKRVMDVLDPEASKALAFLKAGSELYN